MYIYLSQNMQAQQQCDRILHVDGKTLATPIKAARQINDNLHAKR